VEYLWFKWFHEEYGAKALSSYGWDDGSQVRHRIYSTELSMGDWGMCDQIGLVRLDFTVDRTSGQVICQRTAVRTINGTCR